MEAKVDEIFKKVAQKLNWPNYEISSVDQIIGNGFMSEMFFASIKNKDSGEVVDLALKSAFTNEQKREASASAATFKNEIAFYDEIMPGLFKFAKEKGVGEDYDFLVPFLADIKSDGFETIAMENAKSLGYKMVDRHQMLDEDHVKLIFETYGKYHGLSFALKDQNLEKFKELLSKGVDIFKSLENKRDNTFADTLKSAFNQAFEDVDEDIKKKCQKYLDNPFVIHKKAFDDARASNYQCLLHGDCWSNNFMFKYQESKVIAMKILDFQMAREGSPVLDLAYFLYAGSPIEIYGNLDKYLKIYHDSLSKTLSSLGSDPQKVFPWESLKSEWKKYSKVGISISIMMNKVKLMQNEDVQDIVKSNSVLTDLKLKGDSSVIYKKRCKDLLEHTYNQGYLS